MPRPAVPGLGLSQFQVLARQVRAGQVSVEQTRAGQVRAGEMMAVALAPDERSRLVKLMAMTFSNHDREALSALRIAERFLRDRNITWAEVLDPPAARNILRG
jgi:hypothetical protein